MRRGLALGTALSGAAAVLLTAAPAQAQQQARPSLTLLAPRLAPPLTRFHVRANEPLPQDLTRLPAERFTTPPIIAPTSGIVIHRSPSWTQPELSGLTPIVDPTIAPLVSGGDVVIDQGDIAGTADNTPGVDTVATGTTAITVGNISTQGSQSGGVHAYGYGDMTIHAGDIHTEGYRATGLDANTNVGGNSGGIEITAGNIETSGYAASGVRAAAYNGSTVINVNSVKTSGYGADGIYGWSYNRDTTITAGSVETTGTGGRGITAYSGGTTTVDVDSVTTSGAGIGMFLDSGAIKAVGAAVDVHAGAVSTSGDYSSGIYANSNPVHDNGQDDHHITVVAGSVTTSGLGSDGIDAVNTAQGSLTSVTADSVTTSGDYSNGVFAFAPQGDVQVNAGTIETGGAGSNGVIAASYYGNVSVYADKVTTSGANAVGVYSYAGGKQLSGSTTNTVTVDSVKTQGDNAMGIETISLGTQLDTSITAGSVETRGYGATGIRAIADGPGSDITIHAGTVSTAGAYADGIDAIAYGVGGKVTVTADKVTTTGDQTAGIFTYALTGDTNVTVGEVATSGYGSFGISVGSRYGNAHVDAGSITTTGDSAFGISASAGGDVNVSADSVSTQGGRAWGVYAASLSGKVSVDVSNVTTSGAYAAGVVARSFYSDVDVTAKNVHADGDFSSAITADSYLGYGNVHVVASDVSAGAYANTIAASGHTVVVETSGEIDKAGSYSAVTVTAHGGDATVTNSGTIKTVTGGPYGVSYSADGIYARADGNVTINGHGSISTEGGQFGYGVAAYSNRGGAIAVTQNSISTTGGQSQGVVAVTSNRGGADPSNGAGGISVSVGSIATTGWGASGMLLSDNTKLGSAIATVTGDLTTEGDQARGVSIYSANQTAGAHLHNVSTKGYYAQAVHFDGHAAEFTFDGAVSTEGVLSTAIVAYAGNGGIQISGTGPISTKGDYFSSGIRASSPGDITIDVGSISTEGRGSNGIEVTERKRHSEVYPYDPPEGEEDTAAAAKVPVSDLANAFPFPDPRDPETAATGSTISVTAQSIATAGMNANGIMVSTTTGDVDIHSGDVAVTGRNSIGIFAEGRNLSAETGNTSSAQATAIALQGYDSASLAVHGKVQGGTEGVLLQSYANSLTVTSGGSITGAVNGVTIDATPHVTPIVHYWGYAPESYIGQEEPQPLPPANPAAGTAQVSNAGTITAGTGYAITVTGGGADVANSGVVVGAVKFSGFADTFTNSGKFVATKDSDFGGGGDRFVNTGTIALAAPAGQSVRALAPLVSQSVSLLGLETFENAGTIDLRNGAGGETLTITGDYVGTSGAKLGLDVAAGGADKLVITGAATGTTLVQLDVTAEGARLLDKPLALVQAGAGSSAGAFVLASDSIGLVQYGLSFDAATGSFGVTSEAGAPVYRLLKLSEGAQAIWNQSADAWTGHMAELRDGSGQGRSVWGQAYGSVQNHDEQRTIGGTARSLDYRQDFYGGQAGVDIVEAGNFLFGASAGYLSSNLTLKGSGMRIRYDSLNLGGYAAFHSGPFFANTLVQYAHYWSDVRDSLNSWSDGTGGGSIGARIEGGARFGKGRFFVEPVASLSFQNSSFGAIQALGQTVDPEAGNGLTGTLGARVGNSFDLKDGMKAVVYARGTYAHEFDGEGRLSFTSGGTSEELANLRPGDEGRVALGLNLTGRGAVSGFFEGNATFGQNVSGGGGRVGLSFKF
ncbi:autotransporter domain-containing protein [Sphingomonas sp. dw_22]|uniref:beta strand repeat-containing protein n=1 Tax=Sphingomonas sp. dw_22 TaxID=2721175 RepID=UPI001BD54A88|nr:autotransporter domain-containing protein [Sphingomonas sp. dw_22]